jgi:phosphoribosylformylglycinamidine synthase
MGAASVLAECCRNVIAVGAEPIAFLDHLQFGDPNDEEIFWSFSTTVKALADFAKAASVPCVGGKVSFYNQDEVTGTAIKSSPVLSVLGLIEQPEHVIKLAFKNEGDSIILIGHTEAEMGGSEFNHLLGIDGGEVPHLDFELEIETQRSVLECIRKGLVTACHDCSKGGIGAALARMAVWGNRGAEIDIGKTGPNLADHELLFSESNSRFLLTTNKPTELIQSLSNRRIPVANVGRVTGDAMHVKVRSTDLDWNMDALRDAYCNSMQRLLEPWQK